MNLNQEEIPQKRNHTQYVFDISKPFVIQIFFYWHYAHLKIYFKRNHDYQTSQYFAYKYVLFSVTKFDTLHTVVGVVVNQSHSV